MDADFGGAQREGKLVRLCIHPQNIANDKTTYQREKISMTEQSPWSDGAPSLKPQTQAARKTLSVGLILVMLTLGFGAGVLLTWIVNWATLADKERDRARAVANLTELATKVDAAETFARDSKKQVEDMQKKMSDATRQADEASRQLVVARNDASSVRAERDEARAFATTGRAEFDKLKALDANPTALPTADLSKAIGALKTVRCFATVSLRTAAPGLDDTTAKNNLTQALSSVGMTCSDQSPVEMMVLISLSEDQPRRALAVMLLVTRVMKVPGEALSRQVSVWGQQRTSMVNDASASTQVGSLIQELVATMNVELAPTTTPAATTPVVPPAVPSKVVPATTPVVPPAVAPATTPVVLPAVAPTTTPAVPPATTPTVVPTTTPVVPPAAAPTTTPPVAPTTTPAVPPATPPVAAPANGKP